MLKHPFPRQAVLGIPFDVCDYAGVLDWLARRLQKGGARYLCVSNVADVMTARQNPSYARALKKADLVVPDGMPVVWSLRKEGFSIKNRVYGPALMGRVLTDPRFQNKTHCLIGGKPVARKRVREKFSQALWVEEYDFDFNDLAGEKDYAALAERINWHGPDFLWVSLGGGRQVLFMHRLAPYLDDGTLIGVGAAFDFHAGLLPQAPSWMQKRGLESVFRFLTEPRRLWRRYLLLNPPFFYHRFKENLGKRLSRRAD